MDENVEDHMMDVVDVAKMIGVSTKTMKKIINEDETFPKVFAFGPRIRRWRRDAVMEWIAARQAT